MKYLNWLNTRKPYLVSPQGMLDPWALANGHWKKRIVATWFQDAQLQRASCLHAVGESEADARAKAGLVADALTITVE